MSTRKEGLKIAEREYVCFVDGDDFILPDMLYTYKAILEKNNVDIICGGYFEYYAHRTVVKKQKISKGLYNKDSLVNHVWTNMLSSAIYNMFYVFPSVCSKCFRKSIVKKIYETVPEKISLGEDAAVTYPALLRADSIYITEYCGYMYRQNSESMTHSYNKNLYENIKNLLQHLKNVEESEKWDSNNQIIDYGFYLLNFARSNELAFNKTDNYFKKRKNMSRYLNDEVYVNIIKRVKVKGIKKKLLLFCYRYKLYALLYLLSIKNG